MKNLLKILSQIMFEVEMDKTRNWVSKKIARLPFDRSWCVLTYPTGTQNPPEIPYIGGEKYVLVKNSDIIMPLLEVLKDKFKDIRVHLTNVNNEVFSVEFYEVMPDKIKVGYLAPTIRIENSYNGKVKAKAKAGLVWLHKNNEGEVIEEFLNNGAVAYEFKHHSDEGSVRITELAEQVDKILADFTSVKQQIEALKKIEVKEVLKTMEQICPDAKKYPKKAIPLAVELINYDTQVFNSEPNLWLVYTALAQAVKKNESSMDNYEKDTADSVAWANVLEYAGLRNKKEKKEK